MYQAMLSLLALALPGYLVVMADAPAFAPAYHMACRAVVLSFYRALQCPDLSFDSLIGHRIEQPVHPPENSRRRPLSAVGKALSWYIPVQSTKC